MMEWLVAALQAIGGPAVVILLAFSPVGEVRVSIPVGLFVYDMGWGEVIVWSLIGNLAVAPVATWAYRGIEKLARKSIKLNGLIDRIYARTHRKESARIQRLEEAAVALFIAIPFPGSGAWSGVLVAHIFGLEWKKTWSYYYAGVVASTFLVTILFVTGRWVL